MDDPHAGTAPAAAADDCPATPSFRSPPRILIPKLCQSRDAWKAKAQLRGSQLKTLQVRVHDVCLSRDSWRQRAESAEQQARQLQDQVQHLRQQLAAAQQQLSSLGGEKKRPQPCR
jgi:chromosome segregation ATPase